MIKDYCKFKALAERIDENFIEDVITTLPLNTFDDLINNAQYCFPILSKLTTESLPKVDSTEWNILQNILYKLNLQMFHNSLDPQMHGNLNRTIARAIIYHIQCEFQEANYTNKEYCSIEEFTLDVENLIENHPAIIEITNYYNEKETINPELLQAIYHLSYFFISKAEKFISLYTTHIHNIKIKDECNEIIKNFSINNYINYKISDGKILYFFNEIIRLVMFSRNTFAVGAFYFLQKCKSFHKLKIYSSDILTKDQIKNIFLKKNDLKELLNLPMDQKIFNKIYNGLKQILDSYVIFNQGLYGYKNKQ